MSPSFAVLLDAGFLKYRLATYPTPLDATQVQEFIDQIKGLPALKDMRLHRVYFYDSRPLEGSDKNPIDGTTIDFSASPTAGHNRNLQFQVSRLPYVSVRYGELHQTGWEIKKKILHKARSKAGPVTVDAQHIKPNIQQKGVDMRIGLDIASLTLKKHVQVIVLATADSDFIPAMKFARREGAQLILVTLGKGIREGLREHADLVVENF